MSSMGAFNSNNNFDDGDEDDNDNGDGNSHITDYEKYWFHFVRFLNCARTQCAFHLRNTVYTAPKTKKNTLNRTRAILLTDN